MSVQVGDRVRLVDTTKEGVPVKAGDTGKVWRVTQFGTLRVLWDSGHRFDLDPRTDRWEVVSNGHK